MQTVSIDHLTDEELLRAIEHYAHNGGMPLPMQQALAKRWASLMDAYRRAIKR
jgi:hypothetical protein